MGDARAGPRVMRVSGVVAWQWGEIDAVRDGDDVDLVHRRAGARLSVRGGRLVRGEGYAAATPVVRQELARVGAIVRLRQRGRYLVHAAGAVDPSGRAWLLAGDSGSGKSTLGYALTRAGWTGLGDDGVIIERDAHGFRAHAWRDPMKVSVALRDAFPEMTAVTQAIATNDPRQRLSLRVPMADRGTRVAAIVFLARGERRAIRRLGEVAALGALIRQSPWVIIEDTHASRHLETLRHAASLPAFQLEHTPAELHTIAQVLSGVAA